LTRILGQISEVLNQVQNDVQKNNYVFPGLTRDLGQISEVLNQV